MLQGDAFFIVTILLELSEKKKIRSGPMDEKNPRGGGDEDESDEAGGHHATKKSERKRQREKDRRKEEKEAFAELGQAIALVEPEDSQEGTDLVNIDGSSLTRIDLIGRACDVIRKLLADNASLKRAKGNSGEKKVGSDVVTEGAKVELFHHAFGRSVLTL